MYISSANDLTDMMKEMAKKYEELEKVKRKVVKAEDKVVEAEAHFNELTQRLVAHEGDLEALGDITHITSQMDALEKSLRENKDKLRNYRVSV